MMTRHLLPLKVRRQYVFDKTFYSVNQCYITLREFLPGESLALPSVTRDMVFPALKDVNLLLFYEKLGDVLKLHFSYEALPPATELQLLGYGIMRFPHFSNYAISFFKLVENIEESRMSLRFKVLCPPEYVVDRTCDYLYHTERLELFIDNPKFSDVKLVSDDGHMMASKDILAAGSPAFKAMFTADFLEKDGDEVRLEQVTISVLRQVVRFIYLEQVVFQDYVSGFEVFVLADRLAMSKLANTAQDYLASQVKEDNAVLLLLSAKNHWMTKLEQSCISFIGKFIRIKHASVLLDFHLISSQPLLIELLTIADSSGKACNVCIKGCAPYARH
ncbi:Speckle-type POZ protein [Halotydeus destructor]|nr:Speckle-type POZ protein [Halotydeus destructor]